MMGCDNISFTNSFKNLKCPSPPGRYAFLCTLDMLRISDDMSLLRSDKPSVALIFLMLAGTEFVRFVNKPSSGSTIAVSIPLLRSFTSPSWMSFSTKVKAYFVCPICEGMPTTLIFLGKSLMFSSLNDDLYLLDSSARCLCPLLAEFLSAGDASSQWNSAIPFFLNESKIIISLVESKLKPTNTYFSNGKSSIALSFNLSTNSRSILPVYVKFFCSSSSLYFW